MFRHPSGVWLPDSAAPRTRFRQPIPGGWKLPTLAGGGGSWILNVPFLSNTSGGGNANEEKRARFPLTGLQNEPQLRERWSFTSIRLPVSAGVAATVKLKAPIFTIGLVIKRNGDIVFAASQEKQIVNPAVPEAFAFGANFLFTADLNNPFTVDRGQTLAIELTFSADVVWNKNLFLGVSAEQENGAEGPEGNVIASKSGGTLLYNSHTMSGHRTI